MVQRFNPGPGSPNREFPRTRVPTRSRRIFWAETSISISARRRSGSATRVNPPLPCCRYFPVQSASRNCRIRRLSPNRALRGTTDVSVASVKAPYGTPKPVLDMLEESDGGRDEGAGGHGAAASKPARFSTLAMPEQFQADIEKDGLMYRDDFKRLGVELQ